MIALVTAEFPEDAVEELHAAGYEVRRDGWGVTGTIMEPAALRDAVADVSLLVCELEEVDGSVLDAAPELRIVAACRGTPVNVDLDAAAARGIPVLHTPGRNAASVADFTVGLLLALVRDIGAGERHLREAGWDVDGRLPYLHFRGPELAGRTLGVVGFGAIGQLVAQRARDGFGMEVVAHDPFVDAADGVELTELAALFERSDVVSLHAPPSDATRGMVGDAELAALGTHGYLVNTARAQLVDEGALLDALVERTIAGAALDVFWEEPIARDHPLLDLDNVVVTPHLAGASTDVVRHHARMVLEDLARLAEGRRPRHLANAELLDDHEVAPTPPQTEAGTA